MIQKKLFFNVTNDINEFKDIEKKKRGGGFFNL
jgi:hypothetical protein